MAISSPGIGSGLDVNSIVSQLIAIDSQPLTRLNTKEASLSSEIVRIWEFEKCIS